MKNKYIEKIEKEMEEVVNPLLNKSNSLTEKELEGLLKKFGNICRDETSTLRKEALSNNELTQTLLKIGSEYGNNSKILTEIISSINNMHSRYGLEITDSIFQFLLEQTKNKKVNFYVSIFITELPPFKNYKDRFEYIMSIPKIAPKKKSINTFYRVINNNIKDMSNEDKINSMKVFEAFLNDNPNIHESTMKKYSSMIDKLKE